MRPIVCIDPGHGGKDPGAVGQRGLKEKDVVLQLSKFIKNRLEPFYTVILTREKDEYVKLLKRTAIANTANAVLFVAIHCNAADNPSANGIEIIHHPYSEKGQKLADTIMDYLMPASGLRHRGVKRDQRGLAVLRHTKMPSVIIEVGFISNRKEEKLMKNETWLSNVADAIAFGIDSYLEEKE